MGLHKNLRQHHEIGSFATRMLWIPVGVSILVVGFLVARAPQGDSAAVTAVATAHSASLVRGTTPPPDIVLQLPETALVPPDEAIAAHQVLDPVGAGHDVAR
jgi:hypothetical protein